MQELPPQMLPSVPHVIFGIFNLSIPNIFMWVVVLALIALGFWGRIPRLLQPRS